MASGRPRQSIGRARPSPDRTINPDLERFMAKRMGAKTIEVKASHLSLISHPDEITWLILEAAGPMRFLPGIFSSLRRRAAGAPHCIVNPSVWLPFRVRGHPGKGKGAQRSGPAPLCFLMCPATHGRGATQIRFAAEDRR
jgi:hypothetical protein